MPAPHFDDFEVFCAAQPSGRTIFQFLDLASERLPEDKLIKLTTRSYAYAYSENLQDDLLIFMVARIEMRRA